MKKTTILLSIILMSSCASIAETTGDFVSFFVYTLLWLFGIGVCLYAAWFLLIVIINYFKK